MTTVPNPPGTRDLTPADHEQIQGVVREVAKAAGKAPAPKPLDPCNTLEDAELLAKEHERVFAEHAIASMARSIGHEIELDAQPMSPERSGLVSGRMASAASDADRLLRYAGHARRVHMSTAGVLQWHGWLRRVQLMTADLDAFGVLDGADVFQMYANGESPDAVDIKIRADAAMHAADHVRDDHRPDTDDDID